MICGTLEKALPRYSNPQAENLNLAVLFSWFREPGRRHGEPPGKAISRRNAIWTVRPVNRTVCLHSSHGGHQLFGFCFQIKTAVLVGFRPSQGSDPLHEIEDAFRFAALFIEDGFNDLLRF